jgi:cytochrome c-type biogenesis protein
MDEKAFAKKIVFCTFSQSNPPTPRRMSCEAMPQIAIMNTFSEVSFLTRRSIMQPDISAGAAFVAGILSFLSPCVLPLVPAYLSYLAGASLQQLADELPGRRRSQLVFSALGFILGFTVVFTALGAVAAFLGQWLGAYLDWLEKAAGILVFLFGLHTAGVLRIKFLMLEKRLGAGQGKMGWGGPFLLGAAFAFGWTPCVGPILAGVLALAGSQATVGRGTFLLLLYSLGLGIPFILAAWGMQYFLAWLKKFKHFLPWMERLAGLFLMALGVLIFFNWTGKVAAWFGFLAGFGL